MSTPPEHGPTTPLSRQPGALGELLRRSNEEFLTGTDQRAAMRRLDEKLERRKARVGLAPAWALASVVLLAGFYAFGSGNAGSLTASSEPVTRPQLHSVRTPDLPAPAPLEQERAIAQGETRLPDGSSVRTGSAASKAKWRATRAGIRVRLDAGEVRCAVTKQQGGKRFVVDAGEYSFVVLGTELKVQHKDDASRLDVFSGRVEVRRGAQTLAVVSAGGSWSGSARGDSQTAVDALDDSRAPALRSPKKVLVQVPVAPPAAPAPQQDCAALLKQQAFKPAASCYEGQAQGTGLPAELALFELARLRLSALNDAAGAVSALEEHQRRFAAGALSNQVQLAMVRALFAAKRHRQAVLAVEPLIARGGPKVAELQMMRGELYRELGDCPRALLDYEALLAHPAYQDEARAHKAECLRR